MALSPAFYEIAESLCSNHACSVLYSAIRKISESENFTDLTEISLHEDKITGISLNSAKANRILSDFAATANAMLSSEEYSVFSVPLGNLTGVPLLSGRGSKVPLRVIPMGNTDASIISDFSEAGINQTKHSVYIKARIKLRLMAPFSDKITETETTLPLAETVIVGDIPSLYAAGIK